MSTLLPVAPSPSHTVGINVVVIVLHDVVIVIDIVTHHNIAIAIVVVVAHHAISILVVIVARHAVAIDVIAIDVDAIDVDAIDVVVVLSSPTSLLVKLYVILCRAVTIVVGVVIRCPLGRQHALTLRHLLIPPRKKGIKSARVGGGCIAILRGGGVKRDLLSRESKQRVTLNLGPYFVLFEKNIGRN